LRDFFRETFASRTLAEWEGFLAEIDVCWAPVRTLKDAFDDPHTAERGLVFTDSQGRRHIGVPMRFRGEPARPVPELPGFGEHSEALAQEAGFDADRIRAMKDRGVI